MPNILLTLRLLQAGPGFRQALPILRYTLMRQRLDNPFRQEQAAHEEIPVKEPGRLVEVNVLDNGGRFSFDNACLEVAFMAPNLARLSWEPGPEPIPYALEKTTWEKTPTTLKQSAEGILLGGAEFQILVRPDGGLVFLDSSGARLREELPPKYKDLEGNPAWACRARLQPDECLYGLGEQAGPLNHRRATHLLWNTDPGGSYKPGSDPIYMPMPVYLGLHKNGSYLVFHENYFPATFTSQGDTCQIGFAGGMLRTYFMAGSPAQVIERYTELTGRPGMPPLWALGYHQSRWGYKSEADIREVAQGFQEHDMPLSAIHLDIDYMRGYRVFTVDPERFPDLGRLCHDLGEQGIRLVTIIDPGVKEDENFTVYKDGLQKGAFCVLPGGAPFIGVVWPGRCAFPDFTSPEARSWWGEQYPSLLDQGVAGIWHDMNEPTSFAAWGGPHFPLAVQHWMEGRVGDHRQAHNLYALLMNRAGYEALRKHRPERRPWIISRSGWASLQRYAWNWSGDSDTSWESLRMTIPLVLGSGLSGQPYNGPDIGGFSGDPPAELYLRAFQMSTFLPFFRTHSAAGTSRREPWVYGEPYTGIIRQYLHLRYRLLPYFYTLAWEAAQRGTPLVRPLFWADPSDAELWEVDDAFLLGDALLVAPVLEEKVTRCDVCLPCGKWYSFWDETVYNGPGEIELSASLEHIPLLVRAGSILPIAEGDTLTLHVYAPEPGASQLSLLYSDAGEGYGDWRLNQFQVIRDEGSIELSWQSQGEYPFPYRQVELILHGFEAKQAWIDGQEVEVPQNRIATKIFHQAIFRNDTPVIRK
jgi:alpha-glucosidase